MQVVLYRNTNNRTNYYSLDDHQKSLFHPHVLTVRWGSTPDGGRAQVFHFDSEKDKNKKIHRILQEKIKQDYRVLYSYFMKNHQDDISDLLAAQ